MKTYKSFSEEWGGKAIGKDPSRVEYDHKRYLERKKAGEFNK